RRQQPRVAARRPAVPGAPGQVVEQRRAVGAGQSATGAAAPAREALEVAPVAVQRLPGQAALGPDRVEEGRDGAGIGLRDGRQLTGELAAVGGGGHGAVRWLVAGGWWLVAGGWTSVARRFCRSGPSASSGQAS